jgi:hypothetical protein
MVGREVMMGMLKKRMRRAMTRECREAWEMGVSILNGVKGG